MFVVCCCYSMTFPKVLDLNFFIGDLHRQVSIVEVSRVTSLESRKA